MDTNYTLFIDGLIKQRNFSDITPDAQDELRREIKERLDNFLFDRIIDTFSDDDAEKFISLVKEKKSPDELQQFANEHTANYKTFVVDALNDFSASYLGN